MASLFIGASKCKSLTTLRVSGESLADLSKHVEKVMHTAAEQADAEGKKTILPSHIAAAIKQVGQQ